MVFLITLTKSCVDKYQVGGYSYEAYYEVSLLSACYSEMKMITSNSTISKIKGF